MLATFFRYVFFWIVVAVFLVCIFYFFPGISENPAVLIALTMALVIGAIAYVVFTARAKGPGR